MKLAPRLLATLLVAALSPVALAAQPAPPRQGRQALPGGPGAGNEAAGVTPGEIQRMFDAYALVQAQDQLGISDDQYARFLVRYKALQDIRRKSLQEHTRIVADLRRLLAERQPDEALLEARIEALAEVDTRTSADVEKAYEGIDELLDLRQRAGLRVFEELMERRKLELITRARQANRPRQQP
jgi:Spy/CpxP family protein refolding chaperone